MRKTAQIIAQITQSAQIAGMLPIAQKTAQAKIPAILLLRVQPRILAKIVVIPTTQRNNSYEESSRHRMGAA